MFFAENFNVSNSFQQSQKINIFPNPNNGSFSIEIPDYRTAELNMYSNLGKLVYSQKLSSKNELIQLDNLPIGIFILEIKTEKELLLEKVIIN